MMSFDKTVTAGLAFTDALAVYENASIFSKRPCNDTKSLQELERLYKEFQEQLVLFDADQTVTDYQRKMIAYTIQAVQTDHFQMKRYRTIWTASGANKL